MTRKTTHVGIILQRIGLLLLVLSIIVAWSGNFRQRRWEPCRDVARLVNTTELPMTRTSTDRLSSTKDRLLFAWVSGELERPSGAIDYHVMRSDQAMNHLLNWHLKLQRLYQPTETWVEEREVDGDPIVIHWSSQPLDVRDRYLTARLDVLGSRPMRSGYADLLASTPKQVLFGTLPITSYIVEIGMKQGDRDLHPALATEWLEAVVRRNREACGP